MRSPNGREMVPIHWRGGNWNADQVRANQPLRYTRPGLAGRKSPERWRGSSFTEDLFPLERRLLQVEQADQGAELRRVLRVRVGADSSLQPSLLWTRFSRTDRFVLPSASGLSMRFRTISSSAVHYLVFNIEKPKYPASIVHYAIMYLVLRPSQSDQINIISISWASPVIL